MTFIKLLLEHIMFIMKFKPCHSDYLMLQHSNPLWIPFFKIYWGKQYWFFFYGILICSQNWDDHLFHLEEVFAVLQQHQLKVKKQKCNFGRSKIHYLGHDISNDEVDMYPSKIEAMTDWKDPRMSRSLYSIMERLQSLSQHF